MKRSLLASISLIALSACSPGPEHQPASNLADDSYAPGPGWSLVWSDEFDGGQLDPANWNRQVEPAGRFNEEWQRYTEDEANAYVQDGVLLLRALHVGSTHGMDQYTSARLNTAGKQAWTYGKLVARIQLPHGNGIWPAFWTLGTDINENGGDTPWPASGEMDILEFYGTKSNAAVEANIHYADSTGAHAMMGAVTYELEEGRFADAFHIFEMEWSADRIIWRVDGEQYAETSITSPERAEFHKDHFILLNMAVGGTWAGRPDETTEFPQVMFVDWVRVYQQ